VKIADADGPIDVGDWKEDLKFKISNFRLKGNSKEPVGRRRYGSAAEALEGAEVSGDLRFSERTAAGMKAHRHQAFIAND